MVASQAATPLLIKPLINYVRSDPEIGRYEVLQRLVTPSPNPNREEAEIETALETFIDPEGSALWRRVLVRSGPCCPKQVVHASYMLPRDNARILTDNRLCWTAFPERPEHKLLCVLESPTLLRIWDVYPKGEEVDLGGEGHSIPLPFEACGIHAIGESLGLLLQRTETFEDRMAFDAQNKTWTSMGLQMDDDDDGFILKAPPRPARLRESTGNSTLGSANMSTTSSSVPSLFSLSHPLDDVLPISNLPDGHVHPGIITDVSEKIIFVGLLRWTDPADGVVDRKEYTKPICVTFHTHRKRHAIWEIKNSPPPPPQAPLWQVSSQWRSDNGWSSHLGVLQQDLEDMELLGSSDVDSSHYDAATRNEALADALGVRKTPRKVEDMAPRARSVSVRSTSRNRKAGNTSLLSPSSRPLNETHVMEGDMSVESAARAPLLTLGPFSSLHPKLAMTCLYEEAKIGAQAEEVFLVSDPEGSGTLSLCLVCPRGGGENPCDLRLFSFESTVDNVGANRMGNNVVEGNGKSFVVSSGPTMQCIAAQSVESSPLPPCFHPHRQYCKENWRGKSSDLLILHGDLDGSRKLSLYRSNMHIIDCSLPQSITAAGVGDSANIMCSIENSVGSRVDIVCASGSGEKTCLRCDISLMITSSTLSERVLGAVESALLQSDFGPAGIQVATKLRADCLRLEQAITQRSRHSQFVFENTSLAAVRTVILAIFSIELLGKDVNSNTKQKIPTHCVQTAWESLLQSEFHDVYSSECQGFFKTNEEFHSHTDHSSKPNRHTWTWEVLSQTHSFAVESIKALKQSISCTIFDALHALYEDFKLYGQSRDVGMRYIASILSQICKMVPLSNSASKQSSQLFLEHYRRDSGDECLDRVELTDEMWEVPDVGAQILLSSHQSPPCILSWIDGLISGADTLSGYAGLDVSSINSACKRTQSMIRIFPLLYAVSEDSAADNHQDLQRMRDLDVVRILIEEGFTDQGVLRDELPTGVALPLLEVLHRCRSDHEIPRISKDDAQIWSLVGREDLRLNVCSSDKRSLSSTLMSRDSKRSSEPSVEENSNLEDKDLDGICPLEFTSSMLFPKDNRIREVGRLLRSSRPVYLKVPRAIEVSDHDYERLKQEKLLLLSRRVLALPVGRGMFTIGNLQPVPAEPLPLPDICLVGRVPPTNAQLALDTAECPTDLRVWPEFHNGVAAGLRLPLEEDAAEFVSKITRTWIVYNRPPSSGQNQSQNNSNAPNNPSQNLGNAHGGLLMALGLRGHLTTLEMTDIFDYLTQGTVTTTVGVLLGMSANMRGTCDISASKMLCLHIPSLIPQHFSAIDVASPVQAAAVAGAGLLYQGSSHRMMTEFLLNEIGKRPSSDENVFDREAYTLSCGIALGMVNLCQGEGLNSATEGNGNAGLADLRIEERLYRYIVGGLDDVEMRRRREETDRLSLPSTSASSGNEKCSRVYEGESINTDVTAPGATLALGLIYMKSGNKTIASAIALPDTHFLLEYVRPDFLMLRVIARALILWNDVKPSKAWIESQLPVAVQTAYEQMRILAERLNQPESGSALPQDKDFDRQAVRLIYTHVIAGACFAIGLRFAGTGNRDAAAAIFERVMELRDLRDGSDPVSCALRPTSPVLEMCLGCAAISLSMVLAGTGDLDALRLLKVLRWRCDEEVNYGSHMAYGTAIGLLFLGGGSCTLGREPEDIAALLMSFFPRFPSTTSDNQYHLQALRNLYALAVKHREVRAIDVDTGESVFVPVEVHFQDESSDPLCLTAPCLLSNTDGKPRELRVVSERYYPVTLAFDDPPGQQIFFVKRRSAHLSYRQDPHSQRSLLVQSGSFQGGGSLDLIASFTDDQKVLAFAQHLCDLSEPTSKNSGPFSIPGFCSRVLHECLMLDTQEALPLYLAIRSSITSIQASGRIVVPFIWDFRLIRSYYEKRRRLVQDNVPRLLNSELVAYLIGMLENALQRPELESGAKRSLDVTPGLHMRNGSDSIFYNVPLETDLELGFSAGDPMDLS